MALPNDVFPSANLRSDLTIVAGLPAGGSGEAPPDPTTKKCPECLSEIAIAARRCAFCTAPVA